MPLRTSKDHETEVQGDAWSGDRKPGQDGKLPPEGNTVDARTSYSLTWEEQSDGTVDNRPPAYTGATLGGLWRMRG